MEQKCGGFHSGVYTVQGLGMRLQGEAFRIQGDLYGYNGKENGNYYNGAIQGLGL